MGEYCTDCSLSAVVTDIALCVKSSCRQFLYQSLWDNLCLDISKISFFKLSGGFDFA